VLLSLSVTPDQFTCAILIVDLKTRDARKITKCQKNNASPVCILFYINYEIESLEVCIVMKIPPFTIDVLVNDFNVLNVFYFSDFTISPRKTHTLLNLRPQLIKKCVPI